LALTLLELCDQAKHTADSAVVISITQQELSNMLSVSRQTVAACLTRMQGRGILKTMRGKIELYDIAALRREVRHLTCTEN
jgi:Mn-dependent DtxR family transcriptional regulator